MRIKEEDESDPFTMFRHRMMNSFESIVLLEKEHDASPTCWCKPRRDSDGVYIHNRRDN